MNSPWPSSTSCCFASATSFLHSYRSFLLTSWQIQRAFCFASAFCFNFHSDSITSLRRRTRFTEIGTFIFLSGPKFPRNRRFLSYCAKTGSAGADRFRGKSYVPPALSNGICVRAIGLPVWAGHRRVRLFFHFVRTDFAHAYRVQFLRYRNESLQAHCPRGGIVTSKKILGVGPPWGEIFPHIFSRFRSENVRESCPLPRK